MPYRYTPTFHDGLLNQVKIVGRVDFGKVFLHIFYILMPTLIGWAYTQHDLC